MRDIVSELIDEMSDNQWPDIEVLNPQELIEFGILNREHDVSLPNHVLFEACVEIAASQAEIARELGDEPDDIAEWELAAHTLAELIRH